MTSEDTWNDAERPASPTGTPDRRDTGDPTATTELDRLRAEVALLHGRLATRDRRRRWGVTLRRVGAAVLIAVSGFCAVASVIGGWGARTTLDTDRWVATVRELPRQPAVTEAMSAYLTDEVFDVLDVRQRLADALPPRAAFLAGPVTNAVRDFVRDRVRGYMRSDGFQSLWESANRFAHTQIMAVLENRSETVSVHDGTVTLNLLPIVNNLLIAIESELPSMFGRPLDLPTITSGQLPPDLRQRVEETVGVTLPSDFAQVRLYNRQLLPQLQQAVVTFRRLIVLLIAGTVLTGGLALWISPDRRRTILQLGLWLTIAVFVLSYVLRAIRDQLLGMVPATLYREGVSVAVHEVFTSLRQWGDRLLWAGVVLAVVAYLVGPGRVPVALRRAVVRASRAVAARARAVATDVALKSWVVRHVDVLRVGGVAVAAIVALWFSSWTALFVILTALAGYALLLTALVRQGPPPTNLQS
jgi:hypothetical protein